MNDRRSKKQKLEPQVQVADYLQIGDNYFNEDKFEEALGYYTQAVGQDARNVQAYIKKGIALYWLYNDLEAIRCFDTALELEPSSAEAYYHKGLALSNNLDRLEESLVCFDKSIQFRPVHSDSYYRKGITLERLGQYMKAVRCYDQAIEIDPNVSDFYTSKGWAYTSLGNYEEALKNYDIAIALNPSYGGNYFYKSKTLYDIAQITVRQEDLPFTEKILNKAISYFDKFNGKAEFQEPCIHFRDEVRAILAIKYIYYKYANSEDLCEDPYKLRIFESCMPLIKEYLLKQQELLEQSGFQQEDNNDNILGYKKELVDFLLKTDLNAYIKEFRIHKDLHLFKLTGICKDIGKQYPALADSVGVINSFLNLSDIDLTGNNNGSDINEPS